MEEENDKFIILLNVNEAIGLDHKNDKIVVTGSLGGNELETDIVSSAQTTVFNHNLIWETDKLSIKRMKTENLPIKVEVFTANTISGQEIRDLIGYILLPIRGIAITPGKKKINIKPHWHKLIGLNADWRLKKPELSLYLTITEKQNLIAGGLGPHAPAIPTTSEESIPIEPNDTGDMLKSQQGLFIKLLQDEGLLQVGNFEKDCDIFIIKLTFKCATNLENIINSEEGMNLMFRFNYNLLGTPSFCTLTSKGDGVYSIQEKIAIHFRTSLESLHQYFTKVLYIPIDLYYSDTIVGHAIFKFRDLLPCISLQEFLKQFGENDNTFEKKGAFWIDTLIDLPPTIPKPFVEYAFSVKYLSSTKLGNCEIIEDKPHTVEYVDNQAGGDTECQVIELPPTEDILQNELEDLKVVQSDSILTSNINENDLASKTTKSDPAIIKQTEKINIEALWTDRTNAKNIPRTFAFNLILQTVKFTRRPEIGIWQISLHHSKADTPYTVANVELTEISSNVIEFKNLELQLYFASTADDILNLVESEPCILHINGPRGMNAVAELDNEMLLVGTKEKRSGILLMENQSGEKVAMSHVFVYLDDLGLNFNSHLKRHININQPQPYMDENLAYKFVEELEEWKQQQQENFLVELKRKEVNHLAQLSAEWQKRKLEQECDLTGKLEECSKLATALEEAHNLIQKKGISQIEYERNLKEMRLQLEQSYSNKLLELNEKYRRLEDDLNHRLKLEEIKFRELDIRKRFIEQENESLKATINELNKRIEEMERTYLPRDQLSSLFQDVRILNERLEEVQKSKLFYKDQWAKIIREVHRMKSENLEQMELQLKHCKSLSVEQMEELIHNEHSELLSDRDELNLIKNIFDSDNESLIDEKER